MNIRNINTVARYEAKILRRSWLFRMLAILSLVGITFFQLLVQGNMVRWTSWNQIALSSYVPYMNVYLFGIALSITVIFLAGELLNKTRKVDTMEILHARPMSNADYVIGKVWGSVRIFMGLAIVSLLLGVMVNLFFSDAPFNAFLYPLYWVLFLFPSLVFILGFTFLTVSILRNKALTILFMLGFVFLTLFYLSNIHRGFYDFLGTTIPNAYSDIAGYPESGFVVWQRLTWLFLGMGFIGYSIAFLQRIPNRPGLRIKQRLIATILVLLGVCCWFVLFSSTRRSMHDREEYRMSYNRYEARPKLTRKSQALVYKQKGDRIEVTTEIQLVNPHDREVRTVVLYLNPGLKVDKILKEGKEVSFSRDHQVLILDDKLESGDSVRYVLDYGGRIDESICYVDQPDELVFDSRTIGSSLFRSGKRYAMVGPDYTLLTPECLWYPVSIPPLNLTNMYDIQKDFTSYVLKVVGLGEKTILSQGDPEPSGDTLVFRNENPLPGLSLCIGSYKRYSVTADSVSFELYVAEGHDDFMAYISHVQDSMKSILSDMKVKIEDAKGRRYPYRRFMAIEAPASFASYYRDERGESEQVQPEMFFLPERGVGFFSMNFKGSSRSYANNVRLMKGTELDWGAMERLWVEQFIRNTFMGEYGWFGEGNPLMRRLPRKGGIKGYRLNGNLFDISPMFFSYSGYLYSSDYPVMNLILNGLMKPEEGQQQFTPLYSSSYWRAVRYLENHSVKEALEDPEIPSDVLRQVLSMKATVLQKQYLGMIVPSADLIRFINGYMEQHKYRQVDFSDFNREFVKRFKMDWLEILPEWYTVDRIPAFLIRDCLIEEIETKDKDRGHRSYRIQASVYNDSDVDGVVTLNYVVMPSRLKNVGGVVIMNSGQTNDNSKSKNVLVKSKEAKEIVVICEGNIMSATLNTNISRNIPAIITIPRNYRQKTKASSEGEKRIDTARFMPEAGELIVDNDSKGFRISDSSSDSPIRKWFKNADTSEVRYNNFMATNKWTLVTHSDLYGGYVRSGWMKKSGEGNSKAEWSVQIDKAGYYEVFAYIPDNMQLTQYQYKGSGASIISASMVTRTGKAESIKQYYTVSHEGKESEVEIEIPFSGRGWLSLGRFHFSSGESSVVLSDKGSSDNQVVYADAIKWVWDEGKEDEVIE